MLTFESRSARDSAVSLLSKIPNVELDHSASPPFNAYTALVQRFRDGTYSEWKLSAPVTSPLRNPRGAEGRPKTPRSLVDFVLAAQWPYLRTNDDAVSVFTDYVRRLQTKSDVMEFALAGVDKWLVDCHRKPLCIYHNYATCKRTRDYTHTNRTHKCVFCLDTDHGCMDRDAAGVFICLHTRILDEYSDIREALDVSILEDENVHDLLAVDETNTRSLAAPASPGTEQLVQRILETELTDITKFALSHVGLNDASAAAVGLSLERASNKLRVLDLRNNFIGDAGLMAILSGMEKIPGGCRITHLLLSHNLITNSSASVLVDALDRFPTLAFIDVEHTDIDLDQARIVSDMATLHSHIDRPVERFSEQDLKRFWVKHWFCTPSRFCYLNGLNRQAFRTWIASEDSVNAYCAAAVKKWIPKQTVGVYRPTSFDGMVAAMEGKKHVVLIDGDQRSSETKQFLQSRFIVSGRPIPNDVLFLYYTGRISGCPNFVQDILGRSVHSTSTSQVALPPPKLSATEIHRIRAKMERLPRDTITSKNCKFCTRHFHVSVPPPLLLQLPKKRLLIRLQEDIPAAKRFAQMPLNGTRENCHFAHSWEELKEPASSTMPALTSTRSILFMDWRKDGPYRLPLDQFEPTVSARYLASTGSESDGFTPRLCECYTEHGKCPFWNNCDLLHIRDRSVFYNLVHTMPCPRMYECSGSRGCPYQHEIDDHVSEPGTSHSDTFLWRRSQRFCADAADVQLAHDLGYISSLAATGSGIETLMIVSDDHFAAEAAANADSDLVVQVCRNGTEFDLRCTALLDSGTVPTHTDDREDSDEYLRRIFNSNWEFTQADFAKRYGVNRGNFSSWLNRKRGSPASVCAVRAWLASLEQPEHAEIVSTANGEAKGLSSVDNFVDRVVSLASDGKPLMIVFIDGSRVSMRELTQTGHSQSLETLLDDTDVTVFFAIYTITGDVSLFQETALGHPNTVALRKSELSLFRANLTTMCCDVGRLNHRLSQVSSNNVSFVFYSNVEQTLEIASLSRQFRSSCRITGFRDFANVVRDARRLFSSDIESSGPIAITDHMLLRGRLAFDNIDIDDARRESYLKAAAQNGLVRMTNLPRDIRFDELYKIISRYGRLATWKQRSASIRKKSARWILTYGEGQAVFQYDSAASAARAMIALNRSYVRGHLIECTWECGKAPSVREPV